MGTALLGDTPSAFKDFLTTAEAYLSKTVYSGYGSAWVTACLRDADNRSFANEIANCCDAKELVDLVQKCIESEHALNVPQIPTFVRLPLHLYPIHVPTKNPEEVVARAARLLELPSEDLVVPDTLGAEIEAKIFAFLKPERPRHVRLRSIGGAFAHILSILDGLTAPETVLLESVFPQMRTDALVDIFRALIYVLTGGARCRVEFDSNGIDSEVQALVGRDVGVIRAQIAGVVSKMNGGKWGDRVAELEAAADNLNADSDSVVAVLLSNARVVERARFLRHDKVRENLVLAEFDAIVVTHSAASTSIRFVEAKNRQSGGMADARRQLARVFTVADRCILEPDMQGLPFKARKATSSMVYELNIAPEGFVESNSETPRVEVGLNETDLGAHGR